MNKKIVDNLFEKAGGYLKKQMKELVIKGIQKKIQSFIRMIVYSIVGAVLALIGVLFIGIGISKLLSLYAPEWLSWLIVGVILSLLGAIFALMSTRKFK